MVVELRLTLRPEYRDPVEAGVGFVGRAAELARLNAIFQHRKSPTVLVAGHRGVGKSTLVTHALSKVSPAPLVVHLSLPYIDEPRTQAQPQDDEPPTPVATSEPSDIRGQVLRAFARALFFALEDHATASGELKDEARTLYDKTYLKASQQQQEVSARALVESILTQVDSTTTRVNTENFGKALGALAGGAVATGGVFAAAQVWERHGPWWALLSVALVLVGGICGALTLESSRQTTTTRQGTAEGAAKTTETREQDRSAETLEYELHVLLKHLRDADLPTVFVIDELDKLDAFTRRNVERLQDHVIFQILASLKNFFGLGNGVFVFIAGDDFYAQLDEELRTHPYSMAHTLFSDRIFVHGLAYQDMELLVDQSLTVMPGGEDEQLYRRFRNFLCWQSRHHVFDLLTLLGDYVQDYQGGNPILVAREAGDVEGRWVNGNLPANWQLVAGMQKVVGATYEEGQRPAPSEERFNQALWLVLLEAARALVAQGSLTAPATGYEIPSSAWIRGLSKLDVDDAAGSVDRLLRRLERIGLVSMTSTKVERQDENGAATEVEVHEYALVRAAPYPGSDVSTPGKYTGFEQAYVAVGGVLRTLRQQLSNALPRAELPNAESIDQLLSLLDDVEATTARRAQPRSRVRSGLLEADRLVPETLAWAVREFVARWGQQRQCTVLDSSAPTPGTTPTPPEERFTDFFTALSQTERPYSLMSDEENRNQVLVLHPIPTGGSNALLSAYRDVGGKAETRAARLHVLDLSIAASLASEVPLDVRRSLRQKDEGQFSLLAPVPDRSEPEDHQDQSVAGWERLSLLPSGESLRELGERLDSLAAFPKRQSG